MICERCGEEITEPKKAWKQITSYVSPSGAKASTLAAPTGKLMHEACVVMEKAERAGGPRPGQTTIDDFLTA